MQNKESKKKSEVLLNCPYCGGEASLCKIKDADLWIVKCWNRGCKMRPRTDEYESKEEAIAIWNTRKPMERIIERLELYADDHRNFKELQRKNGNKQLETIHSNIVDVFMYSVGVVKEEGGIE